jgi:predicted esterase
MAAATGRHPLADGGALYVPPAALGGSPGTVVVTLHGAGSLPEHSFEPLLPFADEAGLILLAPKSRRATWDIVYGDFGADVAALDELLADLFSAYPVHPGRVFVSGFSDGASYALSLGLTNGDLFGGIVAFSPGFAKTVGTHGKPRVFVSHGTEDTVIPIDRTSRRIVPRLRKDGYDVTYREFAGPHLVPPNVARSAVEWLAGGVSSDQ